MQYNLYLYIVISSFVITEQFLLQILDIEEALCHLYIHFCVNIYIFLTLVDLIVLKYSSPT